MLLKQIKAWSPYSLSEDSSVCNSYDFYAVSLWLQHRTLCVHVFCECVNSDILLIQRRLLSTRQILHNFFPNPPNKCKYNGTGFHFV